VLIVRNFRCSEQSASHPGTSSKDSNKREKFDSGLGDEIIEAPNSSEDENMRLDNDRDEEHSMEKRYKRGTTYIGGKLF